MNDIHLARQCAAREPSAVDRLLSEHHHHVRRVLRRHGLTADEMRDAEQRLWTRLLVGHGGTGPAIAQYAGSGALGGWIRTCATREALSVRRAKAGRPADCELVADQHASSSHDPERSVLGAERSAMFAQAFTRAVQTLDPRERTLLREHALVGRTLEDIADEHRVHRTTVTRWMAKVLRKLRLRTQWTLGERSGTSVAPQWSASDLRLSQVLRPQAAP